MKASKIKPRYKINLPHIQPIGATFFVTFRLYNSIPKVALFKLQKAYQASLAELAFENPAIKDQSIREERDRFFKSYDQLLESIKTGPHYLKTPEIAALVKKELHRFDGELYDLIAYCIMSNHVHILIDTSIQIPMNLDTHTFESLDFQPLQNIMKRIKGPTAMYANRFLKKEGKFWQRESYDRYVRNDREFRNIVKYILNNPVKAGIVENWKKYPHSYWKDTNVDL